MRYYQKYQNWVINENNQEHIQVANNNIAIAKSSENPNQIGRRIGNALGRLNRIDVSSLTSEEKPKYTIAFDEIMKLVQAGDAQALLSKGKRQERFDKIGEVIPNLKGDVEDANKEEITDDAVEKGSEETSTEEKSVAEQPEGKPGEENEVDVVKNSIKANIETGKQITNSSKLPELSQKLSGKATPDEVKFVQAFLKSKGYLGQTSEAIAVAAGDKDVDGNYGPGTAAAVQKYQQEKGLGDDGIVGTNTWNAMLKDVGNTAANVTAVAFDQYTPQKEVPQEIEKKSVTPAETPKVSNKIKPEDDPNEKPVETETETTDDENTNQEKPVDEKPVEEKPKEKTGIQPLKPGLETSKKPAVKKKSLGQLDWEDEPVENYYDAMGKLITLFTSGKVRMLDTNTGRTTTHKKGMSTWSQGFVDDIRKAKTVDKEKAKEILKKNDIIE